MKLRRSLVTMLALVPVGVAGIVRAQGAAADKPAAQDRVVYHIDDSERQATKALRNIRNHLDAAPQTKIIVVAHAEGIDFLMEGARDHKNPNIQYPALISSLTARGVSFEICEITLKNRGLDRDRFVMDAGFTPSGVARIAQLQLHEGFAYIKP